MNITSVSRMYQDKLQEINSRIPEKTNIKEKFSSYLENAQLKSVSEEPSVPQEETIENIKAETDTNTLLSSLLAYNSGLNSPASLFSNTTSENNIFPSMNSSLQVLQQAALLKSLKTDSDN